MILAIHSIQSLYSWKKNIVCAFSFELKLTFIVLLRYFDRNVMNCAEGVALNVDRHIILVSFHFFGFHKNIGLLWGLINNAYHQTFHRYQESSLDKTFSL